MNPGPFNLPFEGVKGQRAKDYPQRVTIYPAAGGEGVQVMPVNAREAVATGHWSYQPVAPEETSGKSGKAATTGTQAS